MMKILKILMEVKESRIILLKKLKEIIVQVEILPIMILVIIKIQDIPMIKILAED